MPQKMNARLSGIHSSAGISQTLISHITSHCTVSSAICTFNIQSTAGLSVVPCTPPYRNTLLFCIFQAMDWTLT